jgi:hypothetical protein
LPLSSSDHVFRLCKTTQLPKDSSIVARTSVTPERCLFCCCLAVTMPSVSAAQLGYRKIPLLSLCIHYHGEVIILLLSSSDHAFRFCYTTRLPKDSSICACAFVTMERCLFCRCLAATKSSGSARLLSYRRIPLLLLVHPLLRRGIYFAIA